MKKSIKWMAVSVQAKNSNETSVSCSCSCLITAAETQQRDSAVNVEDFGIEDRRRFPLCERF